MGFAFIQIAMPISRLAPQLESSAYWPTTHGGNVSPLDRLETPDKPRLTRAAELFDEHHKKRVADPQRAPQTDPGKGNFINIFI